MEALVVADVVTGTGTTACAGSALTVRYVGVLAADGKQFDASWDRGPDSTFPFTLGEGAVIQGWDRGLVGMKVGGRRQLTIPAEQGYGAEGYPPDIPGGASLVFVVDLVKVE
ncbi:MAG: FKBP-type peptidyl-prolyl cis-trans isomerase [Mycobacteriales bacterium]|nr:FKBP-type peptidyl-prolyl cis-trans isomerase [Mycobacteriales bacterium]